MKFLCILVVLSVASPASAQHRSLEAPAGKLIISDRAIAEGMAAPFDSRSSGVAAGSLAQGQGDSLKNGTILGAVIGAVAMGTGVGLLCKALQEPSDPSCWQSVGIGALYGAGIGAVGGLGIDALMTRSARALSLKPGQGR